MVGGPIGLDVIVVVGEGKRVSLFEAQTDLDETQTWIFSPHLWSKCKGFIQICIGMPTNLFISQLLIVFFY